MDEYKGAINHILYNVDQGYHPLTQQEIECELNSLIKR